MTRRLFWTSGTLTSGPQPLPSDAAHYLHRVLRLQTGARVELFDGLGHVAAGILQDGDQIVVQEVQTVHETGVHLTVCSAIPKGERADWLVEKLTELGVSRLQWIICSRSVALPKGSQRLQRWQRLAESAARQAQRLQMPEIAPPVPMDQFLEESHGLEAQRWVAHPGAAAPLRGALGRRRPAILMIGPEGGWTEEELRQLDNAGYTPAGLSDFILRLETAAMAGAALLMAPHGESE